MHSTAMLTRALLCAAALAVGSCDSPTAPLSVPLGRYEAVRVAGRPLTESRICGVMEVASSTLLLESGGRAAYVVHYRNGQSDQIFSGTGSAYETDGVLRVRVRGLWSHALEYGEMTGGADFHVSGATLQQRLGGECDGDWALEYERADEAADARAR